ncbi:hypothetical protein LC574_21960 [Nostoc sp. CHAB 5715]|nr:hypothetical protein [Nostoc sp. CHAB 5715]
MSNAVPLRQMWFFKPYILCILRQCVSPKIMKAIAFIASDYFRVIHHHRHFVPKPEYYSTSSSDTKRGLNVGHYTVYQCTVYVVKASTDIYV